MEEKKYYKITGGNPLKGEIKVSGAKNAATKIIVASLLADDICILENVPKIADVETTLNICRELGAKYKWIDDETVEIDTRNINEHKIPYKYSGAMRTSVLFIAPLLIRLGKAELTTVGGCKIGKRPIDYHIRGFKKLGVNVEEFENKYVFTADTVYGDVVELDYPSVGATENLIMAAIGAEGKTTIKNAAIEPEIENLVGFLQSIGAIIYQNTRRTWIVEGVKKFRGSNYAIIPDRIEAGSFAALALATKGDIFIKGAEQRNMLTFLNWIRKIGGGIEIKKDGIRFFYESELQPVVIETDVHPGFMTDWQPPFVTLLTQCQGVSIVHETVYENRLGFVKALNEIGANIQLHKDCLGNKKCRFTDKNYFHSAVIIGKKDLKGNHLEIPDLRAGFAYIMAALVAEGESKITGIRNVQRGYSFLIDKLKAVGAVIDEIEE